METSLSRELSDFKAEVRQRFQAQERSSEAHEERDGIQFADLKSGLLQMSEKVQTLIETRAEQVGAAKAIAELAERNNRRTAMVSVILGALTLLCSVLVQKHIL
jgi:predicted transcriptional regulator